MLSHIRSRARPTVAALRCYRHWVSTSSLGVNSLGSLRVTQDYGAQPVLLEITTSWEDDCFVSGLEEVGGVLKVDVQNQGLDLHLPATATAAAAAAAGAPPSQLESSMSLTASDLPVVRFSVPEKLDVDVQLASGGDILVGGTKLECAKELHLSTAMGNIQVGRVRSELVSLEAPSGNVSVTKVAEATKMKLGPCQRLTAKRLGGQTVTISASNTTTGASGASGSANAAAGVSRLDLSGGGGGGGASVGGGRGGGVVGATGGGSVVHVDSLYSPNASIDCVATTTTTTTTTAAVAAAAAAVPLSSSDGLSGEGGGGGALVFVDSLHGSLSVQVKQKEQKALAAPSKLAMAVAVSLQRVTGQVEVVTTVVEADDDDDDDNDDDDNDGGDSGVGGGTGGRGGGVEVHFDEAQGKSSISTTNGSVHVMVNHQSALRVALQSVMGGVMDDVTIDGVIDGSKDGGNGCVVVKKGTSFVRDVASQSSTDSSMEGIGTKHKEKEEETNYDEERSVLIGRSGNVVSVSDRNKGQLGRDERDGNRKKKSVLKMSDTDDDDEGRGYKGGDWCSSPGEMVTGVLLPDRARPEAFGGGGGGQVVTLESLSWRDSIKRKFGVK